MNARLSLLATVLAAAACTGLTSCMSPQPPLDMPDASVIGVTPGNGGQALAPDCKSLNQPSGMVDAGLSRRPGVAFGCATYSNLAAMISRPDDLIAPRPYAGADAPLAASAVRRYEEGRATPLNPANSTTSQSGSPAGSLTGSQ